MNAFNWSDYFDTIEKRFDIIESCLQIICKELEEFRLKEEANEHLELAKKLDSRYEEKYESEDF